MRCSESSHLEQVVTLPTLGSLTSTRPSSSQGVPPLSGEHACHKSCKVLVTSRPPSPISVMSSKKPSSRGHVKTVGRLCRRASRGGRVLLVSSVMETENMAFAGQLHVGCLWL